MQQIDKNFSKNFIAWQLLGNVTKIGKNTYLEQTTQYRKKFNRKELKRFFLREYFL